MTVNFEQTADEREHRERDRDGVGRSTPSFYDFLGKKMPALLTERRARRNKLARER